MQDLINWITDNGDTVWGIVSGVIAVAAMVATLTPTPKDDTAVSQLKKLLDILAMNIGHAKNAKPEDK